MRRVLSLRHLLVLSLWSALIFTTYGQRESAPRREPLDSAERSAERSAEQTTPPPSSDLMAFDRAMAEIKTKQPAIPDSVLAEDVQLIKSSLPEITTDLSSVGLTEDDALWASVRGWKTARLESPLRLNPNQPLDKTSFITHVTREVSPKIVGWHIQDEKPEISKLILRKDLLLIADSQSEITASFSKVGWTSEEAQQASLAAWKVARLDSPLGTRETIDGPSFVALASAHMGAVVFISEPDQAEVYVGAKRIATTNKERRPLRWFQDGEKVTVRFTKAEFSSEEKQCIAVAREAVVCRAELKRNQ